MFDGLFGHQLLLLVPLHGAHEAGPDDADHGLLSEAGLLHLLFGEEDDLNTKEEHGHTMNLCIVWRTGSVSHDDASDNKTLNSSGGQNAS